MLRVLFFALFGATLLSITGTNSVLAQVSCDPPDGEQWVEVWTDSDGKLQCSPSLTTLGRVCIATLRDQDINSNASFAVVSPYNGQDNVNGLGCGGPGQTIASPSVRLTGPGQCDGISRCTGLVDNASQLEFTHPSLSAFGKLTFTHIPGDLSNSLSKISTSAGGTAVTVTTNDLPVGAIAEAYSAPPLTASGGTEPYRFAAQGLPPGLSLDATTGVISGTVSQSGTFSVDVTAIDSTPANNNGPFVSEAKTLTLTFSAAPVVTDAPTVTIAAPDRVTGPFEATVTFSEDVTGFEIGDVTVTGATVSDITAVSNSVYSVSITPKSTGAPTSTIAIDIAAGVAEDSAGNGNSAARQVRVTFVDEALIQTRTRGVINNFMANRVDQITANDHDFSQRANRGGSGGSGQAVNFSGEGTLREQQITFGTSLRQVLTARNAKQQQRIGDLAQGFGIGTQSVHGGHGPETGVDIWIRSQWSRYDNENTSGDFGLVFVGADYRFENGFVLGFVTSVDWTAEENNIAAFKADGRGWLAGPYVVANITDSVVFNGRVAWGRSDNSVSPFSTYEDDFESERLLVQGKLTGTFNVGNVLIEPHVGIIYFEDEQEAYVDSNNVEIAGQTVELGRLTFGPKISTSYTTGGGTVVAPYFGVEGIWDFETADRVDIATGLAATGNDDFRGRVEGGFAVGFTDGVRLTGEGFYDGIGADDFSSYGASVNLRLPLQKDPSVESAFGVTQPPSGLVPPPARALH